MGWPYNMDGLTADERHLRRLALDRYGSFAQLSAVVPVVLFLAYRLVSWGVKSVKNRKDGGGGGGSYDVVPTSPALKVRRQSVSESWSVRVRQVQWWLGDDVCLFGEVWGQRDQWIVGVFWGWWMLTLCILGTGEDYMHLTKRFGIVATSQLPIQYLLALKSLNPFALIFRSSHERINRWHRVLGRVIFMLVFLHSLFYLNAFVQFGTLAKRLGELDVILGLAAFTAMNLLGTTSLRMIRNVSYRVFFITHLAVSFLIPPVLFFHARHCRSFMVEALLVFIADLVSRKFDTVATEATLESIPGTNLVKVSAPIPFAKMNRFRDHPGSHVYLSIPPASRPSSNPISLSNLVFEFLYNPFTAADLEEKTGELTLVARHRSGPMTSTLARFGNAATKPMPGHAHSNEASSFARPERKVPLNIEGPYAVATDFPRLTNGEFDRILMVAGGVGATYTVPLYRSVVLHAHPYTKVEMVWAVRDAADATWAVSSTTTATTTNNNDHGNGHSNDNNNKHQSRLTDDENVHIFLTGALMDDPGNSGEPSVLASSPPPPGGRFGSEIEMGAMNGGRRRGGAKGGSSKSAAEELNRRRPDLKRIVDETFSRGLEERVAVLVCGPEEMGREMRAHVGEWAMRGRAVWFHNETFGW